MTDLAALIHEIERLRVGPDEVLVVRPKTLLTSADEEILKRNVARIGHAMGWESERIVVLDRAIDLTIVAAEQLQLGGTG